MKCTQIGIIVILFFSTSIEAFSQCPVISVDIPDSVCISENLNIINSSDNTLNFSWDFCSDDLNKELSATSIGTNASMTLPVDLTIVQEGSQWYGFAVSRGASSLYRLDFGTNLEGTPTFTNLGNIGGLFSSPGAVRLLKEAGNWYGLVVNGGNNQLLRINFGSNIDNNSPSSEFVFNAGVNNGGLEIVLEGNNVVVFVTNNTNLIRANFGNSITNTPAALDIETLDLFPGSSGLAGIGLIRECDQWYGVFSSIFSKQVFYASFGNSILNNPTVTDITPVSTPIGNVTQLSLLKENNEIYAFIASRNGKVFRVEFGEDLSTPVPVFNDLGNFGLLNNTQAFSHARNASKHHFFTVDFSSREFFRIDVADNCFASNSFSNDFNPASVNYTQPGVYKIEAIATNSNGLSKYFFDSVTVLADPEAGFSAAMTCIGQVTSFQDTSTSPGRTLTDWLWDFDDPATGANNTSSLQNPGHSFSAAGQYDVSLTVTNNCGRMTTGIITVTVVPENDLQPDFSTSPVLCSNDLLSFTDISTFTDDTPIAWSWDFGDTGSPDNTSTLQNPQHLYANPGTYDVTLSVTGMSGCEKTIINQIVVVEGPSVSYSFSNDCVNNSITFTNNTTGTDITGYTWDFGDGATSNLVDPTHTFASAGDYTIMLTADNALGCSVTNTQTVTIYALPEVAFINELACSNGSTQFFDQTTVANANITAWAWDFGDGDISTEKDPVHTYQSDGPFLVSLTTTSNFGCVATLEKTVDVIVGPTVDFDINQVCLGDATQFEDLSETSDGTAITSWFWEIDGQVFTDQNPETTFSAPGTYTASLTVTSATFCTATITKDVVINPLPVANFSVENACVRDVVRFGDESIATGDDIAEYSWDFGGLGSASDANPVFTFENTGNYNIGLTITTVAGCMSTVNKTITILDRPEAAFTTDVSQGPPPLTVNFQNNSTGGDSFDWNFGNGESSSVAHPIVTFADLGVFETRLVVSTTAGCRDTVTQTINVVEPLMDLALEGMTTLTQDGETQVSLDIRNNGTLFVDKIEVKLQIGPEATVNQTITQTIAPGQLMVYPLNVSVTNRPSTPYLCATLTPLETPFADHNQANNTFCINLEERASTIKPFPNPSDHLVTVGVILQESQKVIIAMHNAVGQPVIEKEFPNAPEGLNQFQLDVSGVSDGIYWLKLQYGGSEDVFRVFVDK